MEHVRIVSRECNIAKKGRLPGVPDFLPVGL